MANKPDTYETQAVDRPESKSNGAEMVPERRKPGAPYGNTNALKHGARSRDLEKAKKRRLSKTARQRQLESLAALLADQGDPDGISHTLRFVCERFTKRVARLHVMDRAVGKLIRQKPQLRDNPKALAALYDFVRHLENDALQDAKTIGFERKSKGESLQDIIDESTEESDTDGEGAGE